MLNLQTPLSKPLLVPETQNTTQEINILVGVTGAVSGQIIYSMSPDLAKNIASKMLERRIETLDRLAQSALCELENMVSGLALSRFAQKQNREFGCNGSY